MRIILLFIATCIYSDSVIYAQEHEIEKSFNIILRDNREILLTLVFDENQVPLKYRSNIFTQVCETDECKPVRIILFWDLLGNYIQHKLPTGSILTKLDHVPFSEEDYDKFGSILLDNYSALEDLDINALTTSKEKASVHEIDGITGATPKSISNAIVEGAVYTCYTIWHLAHGELRERIEKLTDSICSSEKTLGNFVSGHNVDLRRWSINKIFKHHDSYPSLTREIINSTNPENIFEVKYILANIPSPLLDLPWVQRMLWMKYPEFNFTHQLLLLERYQDVPIDSKLQEQIHKYAYDANERQQNLFEKFTFKEM